ncbi:MAG: methionyl-tRNA formyltransferase [Sphingosinicella sp.]|nr:methionyl-tRNA formyltransferase [Sphingosinicella sp.]
MKFGFVTCVQLGLSCMEAIYEVGGTLHLAVTLQDEQARTKSGRIYLDAFCAEKGIPLLKSRNINDEAVGEALRSAGLDWLFIVGWSQIAKERVLAAPRLGVLGMHPTLLPEGRGRAAVPWAILKQLPRTGVTLFKLDTGVDTGDILDQVEIPVTPNATAGELYAAVNDAHIALIKSAYPKLVEGVIEPRPQNHEAATVWEGRTPEDGRLDLEGSVWEAERLVRAVTRPYPGAFVELQDGALVVWRATVTDTGVVPEGAIPIEFRDGILLALEHERRDPPSVSRAAGCE